ncbi:MAG: DUF2007 domain-containing protein [Pseudomonadota bacterium]
MKQVFTADNIITVAHFKNVLAADGIESEIRNQNLGSVLGEVPFTEVWPQLWVVNSLFADRARQLIAEAQSQTLEGPPWACRHCGEDNEFQFAACWQCATPQSS